MELATLLEPWWRFGAALVIGALVGLEREYIQQRSGEEEFAGIRTFSLITLLGAVAAFMSQQFGLQLFMVAYASLALLVLASLIGPVLQGVEEGITTEVVALLMPLLGALVIYDYAGLAAALAVVAALILALKPALHGLTRRMSSADLRATLEFALITAVVLPLLPDINLGPYGAFNPRNVWVMVVLVSGISFLGYIMKSAWGARRGIGLAGLLGGVVSSTAVTLGLSGRANDSPHLSRPFALGIVLASCVLFPRVGVEIVAVHPPLLSRLVLPLLAMMLAGLVGAVILWRTTEASEPEEEKTVEVENPLKLTTALTFALAFAVVTLLVEAANAFFGDTGVYAASALTGLVDVDAITLSSANLAGRGELAEGVAAVSIMTAVVVNTAVKGGIAMIVGSAELRRAALRVFGPMVVTGLVAGGLLLVLPSV